MVAGLLKCVSLGIVTPAAEIAFHSSTFPDGKLDLCDSHARFGD